jgi:uncharacterized protein (DUF1778 family)
MSANPSLRLARMELKTTMDAKDLLTKAAALYGMDLTSFVLMPAMEKANKVLGEHAHLALSQQGQQALMSALSRKHKPTQALKTLMELPDLPER